MQRRGGKSILSIQSKVLFQSYLSLIVLPRLGVFIEDPDFTLTCLGCQRSVYLLQERTSQVFLVCKFFGSRYDISENICRKLLNHEYACLNTIRELGFCRSPHRVVKPISKNEEFGFLLVEEFVCGRDLDYYVAKAAHEGQHEHLLNILTALARFFFKLHAVTTRKTRVGFSTSTRYFRRLIDGLVKNGVMDRRSFEKLDGLCKEWEQDQDMWSDTTVLVHGDATPTNFIFHPDDGITAIDLERMHPADRMYDIGMIVAELKHHFAWRILRADAAEPFIECFIQAYCEGFCDPSKAFTALTRRNRFYMALGELRIARNEWLPEAHRKWLTKEAYRCLQT
jgi:aminoglycoside phosphotransferase (APT) family kinase protein